MIDNKTLDDVLDEIYEKVKDKELCDVLRAIYEKGFHDGYLKGHTEQGKKEFDSYQLPN